MVRALYRHAVWARWYYAVLASAIVFYESSLPLRLPGGIPQLDKVIHILLYFGVGMAYFNALTRGGTRTTAWLCGVAFLAVVAYGISDEFHQAFVPGRSADWQDVVADAVGGAVAAWLGWRLRRRSAHWLGAASGAKQHSQR